MSLGANLLSIFAPSYFLTVTKKGKAGIGFKTSLPTLPLTYNQLFLFLLANNNLFSVAHINARFQTFNLVLHCYALS